MASGEDFVFHLLVCLFGVLRRFQHCTGHITTGSWKGRGNQYIEFARVVYFHLLEIHFTVIGFLHSNFVILVNRFLSPFLVLWPLLCLGLSLIRLLFWAGITLLRPFMFRVPLEEFFS